MFKKTISFGCTKITQAGITMFNEKHLYYLINITKIIKQVVINQRPCCLFTRESSYCFQRVLAIAIPSVSLSVCLSHWWISQKRCKLGSPIVAYLGFSKGRGHGEPAEREPITEVWGRCPQRGPGAEPLVGGQGGKEAGTLFCF